MIKEQSFISYKPFKFLVTHLLNFSCSVSLVVHFGQKRKEWRVVSFSSAFFNDTTKKTLITSVSHVKVAGFACPLCLERSDRAMRRFFVGFYKHTHHNRVTRCQPHNFLRTSSRIFHVSSCSEHSLGMNWSPRRVWLGFAPSHFLLLSCLRKNVSQILIRNGMWQIFILMWSWHNAGIGIFRCQVGFVIRQNERCVGWQVPSLRHLWIFHQVW